MRVSSGKYKGRALLENKYEHIRPTADIVKQSIFNKLSDMIDGAVVLDLFCGTGALGIEAISRGAGEVVFADCDARSIDLTKKNIEKVKIAEKHLILKGDYKDVIKRLDKRFDLIILDPPYKSGLYEDVIKSIYDNKLLKDNGVIVCEQNKEDKFDFSLFDKMDEKKYGIKLVSFLVNKN